MKINQCLLVLASKFENPNNVARVNERIGSTLGDSHHMALYMLGKRHRDKGEIKEFLHSRPLSLS